MESIMGIVLGGVFAIMISGWINSYKNWERDSLMCSGTPLVVEKEDVVRTFTCKVELKK